MNTPYFPPDPSFHAKINKMRHHSDITLNVFHDNENKSSALYKHLTL